MDVVGIDFTSAPNRRKPIVCCWGRLGDDTLEIIDIEAWYDFPPFERFLSGEGSWIAAIDIPFGQPKQLIDALGWPSAWDEYVRLFGSLTKTEFVQLIDNYRSAQPAGSKHHLRATDKLAKSCSPMMLYGVPVGKMFYEGATRLQRSSVSVLPCRPSEQPRIAIEGYPALVTRQLVGPHRYKGGKPSERVCRIVRRRLLSLLATDKLATTYGIKIVIPAQLEEQLVADIHGDRIDSVLCAVQAAAALLRKETNYGIPDDVDDAEGWIVDPTAWANTEH